MKNKTSFNWQCPHCGKRNLVAFRFQFVVPKYFTVERSCAKCGKVSRIGFQLTVEAVKHPGKAG